MAKTYDFTSVLYHIRNQKIHRYAAAMIYATPEETF